MKTPEQLAIEIRGKVTEINELIAQALEQNITVVLSQGNNNPMAQAGKGSAYSFSVKISHSL